MGSLCGPVIWGLKALPRRLGPVGGAITGLVVMNAFFLCCMIIFDPAMLLGTAPGRGAMLVLAIGAGALLGA